MTLKAMTAGTGGSYGAGTSCHPQRPRLHRCRSDGRTGAGTGVSGGCPCPARHVHRPRPRRRSAHPGPHCAELVFDRQRRLARSRSAHRLRAAGGRRGEDLRGGGRCRCPGHEGLGHRCPRVDQHHLGLHVGAGVCDAARAPVDRPELAQCRPGPTRDRDRDGCRARRFDHPDRPVPREGAQSRQAGLRRDVGMDRRRRRVARGGARRSSAQAARRSDISAWRRATTPTPRRRTGASPT